MIYLSKFCRKLLFYSNRCPRQRIVARYELLIERYIPSTVITCLIQIEMKCARLSVRNQSGNKCHYVQGETLWRNKQQPLLVSKSVRTLVKYSFRVLVNMIKIFDVW